MSINLDVPRGFKPTRKLSGEPWSGAVTPYRVASGYAVNVFSGDVVALRSTGTIEKATLVEQMRGVAVGFRWIQADGVPRVSPFWPAGTITRGGEPAVGFVVDDSDVLFEAVFTGAVTIPTIANIGQSFDAFDAGGSPATGLSGQGIAIASAAITAKPWRFVDFVDRADNNTVLAFSRGLFAPLLHDYRVNTGI